MPLPERCRKSRSVKSCECGVSHPPATKPTVAISLGEMKPEQYMSVSLGEFVFASALLLATGCLSSEGPRCPCMHTGMHRMAVASVRMTVFWNARFIALLLREIVLCLQNEAKSRSPYPKDG